MRGTVAAGLAGAALVTIVALLVMLPGRLLSEEHMTDPVVPATLPSAGVVHASVPATRPVHVPNRLEGHVAPTVVETSHPATTPAPHATPHVKPAPQQQRRSTRKPARQVAPVVSAAATPPTVATPPPPTTTTAEPPAMKPAPAVRVVATATPAPTPALEPAPTPASTPKAVVQTPVATLAVAPKASPRATLPPVSVTVGSGKVRTTLVATVRDGSDAEAAQYAGASAYKAAGSQSRPDRDRDDRVRPVAETAGESAPEAPGAGAPARHEDRHDRGETRRGEDRRAEAVGGRHERRHGWR
jgi:hypothetical protein